MEQTPYGSDAVRESTPVEFRNWDNTAGENGKSYVSAGMGAVIIDAIFVKEKLTSTTE